MDTLHINNLQVSTYIGVYAWEQQILQTLLIDLTFYVECESLEDSLENTLDYEAISKAVTSLVQEGRFQLIETVANKVAQLLKEVFRINKLIVRVAKPQAIANAKEVSITIHR